MSVEIALGIAGVIVVAVVLVRQRPGKGTAKVSTGLFSVSAEQADASRVNVRDVQAGRDVHLQAENVSAEKVDAGRDFSAGTGPGGQSGPLGR
jgi:hypothetical protein